MTWGVKAIDPHTRDRAEIHQAAEATRHLGYTPENLARRDSAIRAAIANGMTPREVATAGKLDPVTVVRILGDAGEHVSPGLIITDSFPADY